MYLAHDARHDRKVALKVLRDHGALRRRNRYAPLEREVRRHDGRRVRDAGALPRTIVEALSVRLSAQERNDLAARPIADLEAYQLYLQVRQCLREPLRESLERAHDLGAPS